MILKYLITFKGRISVSCQVNDNRGLYGFLGLFLVFCIHDGIQISFSRLYWCVLHMKEETRLRWNVPVDCYCMHVCVLDVHWVFVFIQCKSAYDWALARFRAIGCCYWWLSRLVSLTLSQPWLRSLRVWSHAAWIVVENVFFFFNCWVFFFFLSRCTPSHKARRAVIDLARRRVSAGESACSWETMARVVRLEERKSCWLWYVTEQQINEWRECLCRWKYEGGGAIRKWTASERKQQSRYYSLGGWKSKKETYRLRRVGVDGGKWRGLVSWTHS